VQTQVEDLQEETQVETQVVAEKMMTLIQK
jgi:hypothetical protein